MSERLLEQPFIKFLEQDGTGPFSQWRWPLPMDNEPGEWTEPLEPAKLELCRYGYHFCDLDDRSGWLNQRMFVFEPHPQATMVYSGDKGVCTQARLVREIPASWSLFANIFADFTKEYCEQYRAIYHKYFRRDDNDVFLAELAKYESLVSLWHDMEKPGLTYGERRMNINVCSGGVKGTEERLKKLYMNGSFWPSRAMGNLYDSLGTIFLNAYADVATWTDFVYCDKAFIDFRYLGRALPDGQQAPNIYAVVNTVFRKYLTQTA